MRVLDAADTAAALPVTVAIAAMEEAFGDDRETPVRVQLGASLFMPGRVGEHTGVKVVSTVPGRPLGTVLVFGPDGSPLGIVDGPTLTAVRTGAAVGLAARVLSPSGAATLAMLGAGAMAAQLIEAVRAVRPIRRLVVWSRSADRAARLAALMDGESASTPDEAVTGADIVVTATPSRRPLFSADSLDERCHVSAIGSFTPDMAELPPELLHRAFVVVDDREAAAAEAGDLIQAGIEPDATIGDLLAGRIQPPDDRATVFKSVGIASQDVAAAVAALQNAAEQDIGRVI